MRLGEPDKSHKRCSWNMEAQTSYFNLHSYTMSVHVPIHIYEASFLGLIILSCQRPCPTAALQVSDSKVTGTANCMGLGIPIWGFESW